jgi:DNA-binding response OmpR family regulator
MKQRILIIDADGRMRDSLAITFSQIGYEVATARTGLEGLHQGYDLSPDLILLAVQLPDLDGWQLCQRFRAISNVPIMILTSLGSEADIVKGLGLGADDYLVKPVRSRVLVAKVKAVLRRAGAAARASAEAGALRTVYDELMMDFDTHEVTVAAKQVDLTPTEFNLLAVFMTHQGRTLSTAYLLTQVWGAEHGGEPDRVRLYISYLRQKIEPDPATPKFIQTVWGVGYRLG